MSSKGIRKRNVFILSLDVGTTTTRCFIYDEHANTKGFSCSKTRVNYPSPGHVEMDENCLWEDVLRVMKGAMAAAGISAAQLTCMGLSTQRNTFILWDRETGKTFHPFISWKDHRAKNLLKSWNDSYTMRSFHSGSKLLHFFTRQKRYLSASSLNFSLDHVSMRLAYMLDDIPQLRQRAVEGNVAYGTIDTWLLWKFSGGKLFVTDYSSASCSGLYDPFQLCWSEILCNIIKIPTSIFPEVVDTSSLIGFVTPEIFGSAIQISSLVADQQAAMFGECCFNVGDVKCTLGSGTFIDLNTGPDPHASIAGLYPVIGWKIGSELVYLVEGGSHDTSVCVEWGKSMGFFNDVSDTADIAESVTDTDGVCFVPAFSGLQAPINDDSASCLMIGMTPTTTKAHITRAILDSIAFRCKMLYEVLIEETNIPITFIRADGGVSNNSFVLQLLSGLINQTIDRPKQIDMSSLGAAFLAGMAMGVWKDKEELKRLRKVDKVFRPDGSTYSKYRSVIINWERAVKRSMNWYKYDTSQRPLSADQNHNLNKL